MNALSNLGDSVLETLVITIVLAILAVFVVEFFSALASTPGGQAAVGIFNGVLNSTFFAIGVIGTISFAVGFAVWLLRLFDRQPGAI